MKYINAVICCVVALCLVKICSSQHDFFPFVSDFDNDKRQGNLKSNRFE